MKTTNSSTASTIKTNNTYKKVALGVYQRGKKSFHAVKMVNGVVKTSICTSKSAAISARKAL